MKLNIYNIAELFKIEGNTIILQNALAEASRSCHMLGGSGKENFVRPDIFVEAIEKRMEIDGGWVNSKDQKVYNFSGAGVKSTESEGSKIDLLWEGIKIQLKTQSKRNCFGKVDITLTNGRNGKYKTNFDYNNINFDYDLLFLVNYHNKHYNGCQGELVLLDPCKLKQYINVNEDKVDIHIENLPHYSDAVIWHTIESRKVILPNITEDIKRKRDNASRYYAKNMLSAVDNSNMFENNMLEYNEVIDDK